MHLQDCISSHLRRFIQIQLGFVMSSSSAHSEVQEKPKKVPLHLKLVVGAVAGGNSCFNYDLTADLSRSVIHSDRNMLYLSH